MANMADQNEEEPTIADDVVVTKYKMAAEIVNNVLKEMLTKCVAGAQVIDICAFGDRRLTEETAKVYRKDKEIKKGIAFPACVSINNCVCHYSPLKSDANIPVLKDGDLVKIDMGAHVDGFPAVVAYSLIIGASPTNKATGRKADAVLAAHYAAEAALRQMKGGVENYTVTDTIQKAVEDYKCKPVEGMLSHQLQQHRIDGDKAIILNPTEAQRKEHEKCEFDVHEVYALDVLVSTGEGKARDMDSKTTVFKRKDDVVYQLKMKASRNFLSEADKTFGTMPFTLRAFEDESKARLGVPECVKHGVVEPFPVLYEKEGELVAQIKYTVLLMPNGPMRITVGPLDLNSYESENSIQNSSVKELLAIPLGSKAAKKKKKAAAKAAAVETAKAVAE